MSQRLNYYNASPDVFKTMLGLEKQLHAGLETKLLLLVKVRASLINGCAYCIDMHWKDARAEGESEERLYNLSAWRESPLYSDKERAALAWTEALTLVSQTHAPDAEFHDVSRGDHAMMLNAAAWQAIVHRYVGSCVSGTNR